MNIGYFICFILKNFINKGKKPDYFFSDVDKVNDEEMFKILYFVEKSNTDKEVYIKIITLILLKKQSTADYFSTSHRELLYLLDSLISSKYN